MKSFLTIAMLVKSVEGWVTPSPKIMSMPTSLSATGAIHGENACFLPLEQCDDEYFAPRIVQVSRLLEEILQKVKTLLNI